MILLFLMHHCFHPPLPNPPLPRPLSISCGVWLRACGESEVRNEMSEWLMLAWQCWLTLVWMVLMSVAACRLTNGRPRRKLHFLIARARRSPRELFIRHWRQAFNLEPPNGNEWALQRMLDTISHAQVRGGFACLSLTSCSLPPFSFFCFWLLLPSHLWQFTPFNSHYLSFSGLPSIICVFFSGSLFCVFPLSFSPSRPTLTIFVCCSSLQHLINSYSPPPSFTPFQEPHNKCREEGTDWGDLHWAYKEGLVK